MPSNTPGSDLHSHFTGGSEPSFEIVRTQSEASDVEILDAIRQLNFSPEDSPSAILDHSAALIDECVAQGIIPKEERMRLVTEARDGLHGMLRDFSLLAQSMGVHGERVETPDQLAPALKAAIESGEPRLVEVLVENNP